MLSHRQDKASHRDCAVCKEVFTSVSMKSEKKKHHCRACGRVVCHNCSPHEMHFTVTDKIKRVCRECLVKGQSASEINVFDAPVTEVELVTKDVEDDDDSDVEDEEVSP